MLSQDEGTGKEYKPKRDTHLEKGLSPGCLLQGLVMRGAPQFSGVFWQKIKCTLLQGKPVALKCREWDT